MAHLVLMEHLAETVKMEIPGSQVSSLYNNSIISNSNCIFIKDHLELMAKMVKTDCQVHKALLDPQVPIQLHIFVTSILINLYFLLKVLLEIVGKMVKMELTAKMVKMASREYLDHQVV